MIHLKDIKIFEFKASSLIIIQIFATISAILGLWHFEFSWKEIITFIIFYFLYIGIGVSMTLHRHYTHRSFNFRSNFLKKICTLIALLSGRGSILGWVYIHREHHVYADTKDDPHSPEKNGWKSFLIPIPKDKKNINKTLIKEFFTRPHLLINRFYLLIIFLYTFSLFIINPWLFYFTWALPIAIGHLNLNIFTYVGHSYGYINFPRTDRSKNNFILGLILFGEGWHNNHHARPKNFNFSEKWWELDIISYVIKGIKK
jgi:stearoyl-CoA desaturase (delta-9 desaturase)